MQKKNQKLNFIVSIVVAVFGLLVFVSGAKAANPTITSVVSNPASPISLLTNTSIALTINGTNFASGAIAEIVGPGVGATISGTSVVVVNATQITANFDVTTAYLGAWNVVVTNVDGGTVTSTGAISFTGSSGTYTAPVQDMYYSDNFGTFNYASTLGANTTITIKVRAGNTPTLSGAWTTIVNASTNASGSVDLASAFNGNRYIQYQSIIAYSGSDPNVISTLDEVSITHNVMSLVSSPYDTTVTANKMNSMTWDETKPGSSDVVFQVRTSANNSTWTSWFGPDGTVGTWFTSPTGGEFMPASFRDGSSDRYFQYRAILIPDGTNYPIFSNVQVKYYTTLVPAITSISPVSVNSITNPATSVTMTINGNDFMTGATVNIINSASGSALSIPATSVTVVNTNQISATFNFDSDIVYAGAWDVKVTNADATTVTSSGAFTISNNETISTSPVLDLGAAKWFSSATWTETTGTSTVKIRAGNTATPDGTWADYVTLSPAQKGVGGLLTSLNNKRYVQYVATTLSPYTNTTNTVTFDDLQLSYSNVNNAGTFSLIGSPYNTNSSVNVLGKIVWTATLPDASTSVQFQLRTAPDSGGSPGTWTDWLGPDGTNTSYFVNSTGTDTMPSVFQTGSNDQWIQYKAYLSATVPGVVPTLSNVVMQYSYNVPPAISSVSYTQNSSGTVSVPYTLSETYDYLGNIAHGTSGAPIKALLFWQPDSAVTSPVLTNSQTGIITLTNTNSQPIPTSGSMLIDSELMTFDSTGCTGNQRNILTRGATFDTSFPTTAASHSAGAAVFFNSSSAVQTINNFSATGTPGANASTSGNSFVWDPRSDSTNNLNGKRLTTMLFKVVANDADVLTFNTIGQSSITSAQTLDLLASTFTTQYYSDSGLTTSLGTNPKLKAGTYYIKISANESLSSTPTISINAEGTANDVTSGATTLVSGNDYKYTRTITSDSSAIGTTIEDFSISGTDSFSNTATNVNPTDEASKAGYTDTTAPTFTTQYYSDSGLTNSLGTNPKLKAGTYYIKVSANEALSSTPTISIAAEGTANDVTNGTTTLISANDYKYTRVIASDSSAIGTTIEDFSLTGTDIAGNTATNINPTDESTKAGYTDTVAPTAAITYYTSDPVKSGASLTITATFNESMADSPAPKIAISGANTLSATDMTKTDATHYYYVDTVGSGNGTATVALSIGTDIVGNVVTAAPSSGATFIVDNTAPTSVGTPTLSSYLNNTGNTTVSWSQTTETYFKDYLVQRKIGSGGTFATLGTPISNIATLNYADNSALSEGTYYYQIIAEDTAGNMTASNTSSAFIVDKTAPILQSFNSSSPNSNVNDSLTFYGTGDHINIQAVFNENIGNGSTMTVKLENTAESQVLLNQVSGATLSGTYTVSAPGSGISDDSPDVAINQILSTSVTDISTNLKSSETVPSGQNLSDNKNLIVDTVPPSLESFSATNGNYKAGDNITVVAHYNKSVKAGSNIHVKINSDGETNTIDLTTVSTSTIAGTYTVGAGDNTQNLKVVSIVSQAVADVKNNQLTDTNMPSTNITDGVLVDTTNPVITFSDDVDSNPNQSDTVTINVTELNQASDKYIFSSDNICNTKNYASSTSFGSDTPIIFNTETNNGKYICTKSIDASGNISYQASLNSLNIDITAPTGTIQINRSLSSGQIQLTAADPNRTITGLQMRSVKYDDDTTACDLSLTTWGDYTNTLDLTSSSELVKACVEYKDVAGNTTILSAAPPRNPVSFQYFDVSDPDDYRVFLSWKIPTGHEGSKPFYQYQLFQCSDDKDNEDCTPDSNGAPDTVISQESTNYKTYFNLLDTDKYCYQVRFASHDVTGTDYSDLGEKRCVVPSSASSSVTKDVAIQFPTYPIPDDEIFANQATVHWDTVNASDANELLPADSQVCWRVHLPTPPGWNCRSYESYETNHAITISKATERLYDLVPNTEYDYQVRSRTSWDKTATMDGSTTFTTKDGAIIKNINTDPIGNTTATVSWTTENKDGDPLASSSSLWYASALSNDDLVTPKEAACDDSDVTNHNCTLVGLNIGTQYYFYVESTVNNATSRDSANGEFYRFTTLSDITPPLITPNADNPLIVTDTQAALSWETDERANAWLLYSTANHESFDNFVETDFDPTNVNRNPYSDYLSGDSANLAHTFIMSLDSLEPNTTYYYRMVSEDTSKNVSVSQEDSFSTLPIQETHLTLTNPGNPLIAQYSDTEAVIYLPAANTEATSKICWDIATITDMSNCANHSEINTPTKSHYYHLTGLTPNITYHVMTKISDSETPDVNNFNSSDITFNTQEVQINQHNPIAKIMDTSDDPLNLADSKNAGIFSPSILTDNTAVLKFDTFDTNDNYVNAKCQIKYREDGMAYSDLIFALEDDYNANHSISIGGLIFSTKYFFQIECTDNLGNKVDSQEFNFKTLQKQTGHVLLTDSTNIHDTDPTVVTRTDSEAIITFDAGTTADSKLCQSDKEDIDAETCVAAMLEITNSRIHSYHLTNLIPNTTYYIKMKLTDSEVSDNTYTTGEVSFETEAIQMNHLALKDIALESDTPTITMLTDTEAVVTFNAGTTSNSKMCYGIATGIDMESCTGVSNTENNKLHIFHLTSLTAATPYFLKMKIVDSENSLDTYTTKETTFTTLEKQIGSSAIPAGDTTASQVSGVSVGNITGESATITWNTDEKANSLVAYSQEGATTSMTAGDNEVNLNKDNYSTSHTVIINNLTSNIKYIFSVYSLDVSGNIAQSSESSFTTADASSISSIKVVSKAMGQATITWTTGSKISSTVDYGLDTTYGKTKQDSAQTKEHEITLTELTPGETYHFRVKGEDAEKNIFASSDITFQPNSPPKISNFKLGSIYEHGATIIFDTNVPTNGIVTYVDAKNAENSGFQGQAELAIKHEITLKNMVSGVTYAIKVKVRDEDGNETEEDFPGFTTGKDENPPKIDNVHNDSALAQADKVQTIITWKTDEQSTSTLIYREGRTGEEKEFKNTDNLSTNHVVVITSFKPGTVYNFRVKSVDASGNTAISEYFSFLTPKMQQNIIQIITTNFMEIFGWTSKVGK